MNTRTTLCLVAALAAAAGLAIPKAADAGGRNACGATTKAAYSACLFDALDGFWIGAGQCANEPDTGARNACLADARATLREGRTDCREQRDARGEGRREQRRLHLVPRWHAAVGPGPCCEHRILVGLPA